MGANFKVESNIAIIGGIENYTGARVNAPDLRAGAALVIAGLAAEGITQPSPIGALLAGDRAVEPLFLTILFEPGLMVDIL